jgi:uncharacterized phage-like protein YoqJ
MYRVGIVGHRPEYISDRNAMIRVVDRVIDLISYQYGEELIINVGSDIGVGQWAAEICQERKIKYHLFLPCPPDTLSSEWYEEQQLSLNNSFKNAWATTIYSMNYNRDVEKKTYEHISDMSDFIICFWNGMKQGPTFTCVEYALKQNKLTLNGLKDLKLVTNEDTGKSKTETDY